MAGNKVSPQGGEPPQKEKHPLIIYHLALCATVGGMLFGYDTGIINGANLLIKDEFNLEDKMIEDIVSAAVGAAAIFSLFSGIIADAIGRKMAIMGAAVVFTIGGFEMGFAQGPWGLIVGRITVGAGIGVVSSVVPVYVSECAPASIRGFLITLNQLFITLGIWLSSIIAALFQELDSGWRYMLGLAAIPGIVQFIFFLFLPESPRYQVMRNNVPKARATLKYIRGNDNVEDELNEIVVSAEEERKTKGWRIWKGIFTTPHVRYALFLGCMLQLFQQFCGINTVIYYSSNILKSAGFDVKQAIWLSVIPFTVNFLATFIGLWAVEALGRVKVLAASFISIAFALLVLVMAFLPSYLKSPDTSSIHEMMFMPESACLSNKNCWDCSQKDGCAFCAVSIDDDQVVNGSCLAAGLERDKELFSNEGRCARLPGTDKFVGSLDGMKLRYTFGYCPSDYAWLAVAGLILFVLGFAPGAGPMPWTINAEIYPLWSRSVANSLATVCNWGCNYIVSNFFLTAIKLITSWGVFLVFAGFCIIAALFVLLLVPETKDISLEEIELLFMTKEMRALTEKNRAEETQKQTGAAHSPPEAPKAEAEEAGAVEKPEA